MLVLLTKDYPYGLNEIVRFKNFLQNTLCHKLHNKTKLANLDHSFASTWKTCHIYFYNWTKAIFFTYLIILIFMFVVCVYKYMLVDDTLIFDTKFAHIFIPFGHSFLTQIHIL